MKSAKILSLLISLLLCGFSVIAGDKIPVDAPSTYVEIIRVIDGDTVEIMLDGSTRKVRLEGIDAPEKRQPFSDKSTQTLKDLLNEKSVTLKVTGTDRYGRILGKLFVGDSDINREMIELGLAWHYEFFNSEIEYADAQKAAQKKQLGVWSEANPVPPWAFRKP